MRLASGVGAVGKALGVPAYTALERLVTREGMERKLFGGPKDDYIPYMIRKAKEGDITDKDRKDFYKEMDNRLKNKEIDKEDYNDNIRNFIRESYFISGSIVTKKNAYEIKKMNKEDRKRLLRTYNRKVIKTIRKHLNL